jgi:hypothetical protein
MNSTENKIRNHIKFNSQAKTVRWGMHVSCMGEMRNAHKILVKNPEEKRPLAMPSCGWKNTNKNLS